MINVTWHHAKEYTAWLSQKTGKKYRLLSEAEWEYAARAGTNTPFYTGACISVSQANFDAKYEDYKQCGSKSDAVQFGPQPAGHYPANRFGLYEMVGNVEQWTEDTWHSNYAGAPSDGSAWTIGDQQARRVVRGGSWKAGPQSMRSANRGAQAPDFSVYWTGFRIARTD